MHDPPPSPAEGVAASEAEPPSDPETVPPSLLVGDEQLGEQIPTNPGFSLVTGIWGVPLPNSRSAGSPVSQTHPAGQALPPTRQSAEQ
jgi:hypothetical protein